MATDAVMYHCNMLFNLLLSVIFIYITCIISCESKVGTNGSDGSNNIKPMVSNDYINWGLTSSNLESREKIDSCWMDMNAKQYINSIAKLDEQYATVREDFKKAIQEKGIQFDQDVLQAMITSRGQVGRAVGVTPYDMPAGLNLGGYCMMRMPHSVLFFHRMKLRNETRFRINELKTDFDQMRVRVQLSLHDLHLVGSYERATTEDNDPSIMYYAPSYGQVEILLKDVEYKVEGRLKILKDSPYIVLTDSEIDFKDALMLYKNNATDNAPMTTLEKSNIEEFVDRMKSDLDLWLKDYLNEQFIFFTTLGSVVTDELREYHKKRSDLLNNFMENSLGHIKKRIYEINATAVKLPSFSIYAVNGVELKLSNGVLRELDSIYRRSVATGAVSDGIHKVDAIVGFSNLKVVYKYTAFLNSAVPPLTGLLAMSADELTAHLSISLIEDPESADLAFDFLNQLKPESLTVEGPANRMIANFKHLLEHHVVSIMSNALTYNIRSLSSLTHCKPLFFGYIENNAAEDQQEHAALVL